MQHGKNFGTRTPRLFGIFNQASIKSDANDDVETGVVKEEININAVKAKVERTRAEALQASRLTIL